jgi:two-component system sensor histidine kinase KdpD
MERAMNQERPDPDALLARVKEEEARQRRGKLKIFFGAAPGVGKTFAMLEAAREQKADRRDVVVGYVETHGRAETDALLEGLDTVPVLRVPYQGVTLREMDLDAVLARRPAIALVDELAHTNVPGSRHAKRFEDVEELLAAGIDVITTVNIQHLESLNDVVEKITGVVQRETVPDAVVRAADQVELRDMTAEALRRRLAHGNVYAPEKVDAALSNYFRTGNLNALRELALLWVADRVDEALQRYREQHEITGTWEARERVVVALTGGPEGDTLVRRAARIAARSSGGDLLAVHVARSDGLAGASAGVLASQRALVESLGGTYHQVLGDDVSSALLAFARAENATQLVLGDSRRRPWERLLDAGTTARTVRESGDIDVHLVTHDRSGRGRMLPRGSGSLSRRRRARGLVLALLLPVLLTLVLAPLRDGLNLVSDVLLFLLMTVVVALVGGRLPAVVAALLGSALLNYYFTPPLYTFTIGERNNSLALLVFLAVAALVSSTVDLAARRTRQAIRAAAEARTLANLVTGVVGGPESTLQMLQGVRETFGLDAATLLERVDGRWTPVASAGPETGYEDADVRVPARDGLVLALRGGPLAADDQLVLGAFAAHTARVLDHVRLTEAAAEAAPLAAADRVRTALLSAVGHDFRAPLAAAKASVSTLRSPDLDLPEEDRRDLLASAETSLDRLHGLVENVLDLSRLQAGALSLDLQPTAVEEVVSRSLDDLGSRDVVVEPAADRHEVPLVMADPGLLERVLVNVVANALRHSPPGRPPYLTCSAHGDHVEVRVIDRGPGIPPEDRERVFLPFQRLGDTDNTTGLGLGLALSRGLVEAMGGELEPEETPGGGLTMVVRLRTGDDDGATGPGRRERGGEA